MKVVHEEVAATTLCPGRTKPTTRDMSLGGLCLDLSFQFRDQRRTYHRPICTGTVFSVSSLEFLGREVSEEGIRPAESRIQDLKELQPPKSKSQVRSVLGLFNFFRNFVKDYSTHAAPLQELTSKKAVFSWTTHHQKSFDEIKRAICKRTLLSFINFEEKIILQTDESDKAIGGILYQPGSEGNPRVVMFMSKALSSREQRWSTNEKEAFAIKYCIERCEHYLRGTKFELRTDHANLLYMHKAKSSKVQRWWTYLADFDFNILHVKGKSNVVADGLLRVGCEISSKHLCVSLSDLSDDFINMQKHFKSEEKEAYTVEEGFLVDKMGRKVIPQARVDLKKKVFEKFHCATVGHHGSSLTQFKIQAADISWPSIASDIRDWIKECPTCAKLKAGKPKNVSRLRSNFESPFQTICVDSVGPFPQSKSGYEYIIVMTDRFSRWTELCPAKSTSSNGAVERVNREIKRHLLALIHDTLDREDWDMGIPIIQNIINHTPHSATKCKPIDLIMGKRSENSLIADYTAAREESKAELPQNKQDVDEFVKELTENIKMCKERALFFEKREREHKVSHIIATGTYVLIRKFPPPKKLEFAWEGPYIVITKTREEVISSNILDSFSLEYLEEAGEEEFFVSNA
ncbi:DDE-type integrase/transposase/recombinase [Aduncisulcus paluster]|uniref:DDE-type integrase/transposase/recombinase n=1 Tax=Aduncisulcus paluster TaxID=2918883 RepID=A0ABQ5KID0_9EUKA|nr:DDE-type integrase/transposase/recombinase [Aduncisulcus paluster]